MELRIEKLIYGGDGLARLPSPDPARAGKAVFVPCAIPGERVDVKLVEEKPGFARARVERIVERSPERSEPGCPYFGECGGCQYQHLNYEAQLQAKAGILRETLLRTAKIEAPEIITHASPPWNYRNRTRVRVRTDPEFAIGYNRFASHVLLPIRECPISSPLINRVIAAIWKLGKLGSVPVAVHEVELFANAEDTDLILEVTLGQGSRRVLRELAIFADALRAELPVVAGFVPFTEEGRSVRRLDIPEGLEGSFGHDSLFYRVSGMQYQVSAGSFFQTNRFLVEKMLSLATDGISGGYALDLYAGVGLFTLPLSQNFREVAAVEIAPFSFHDLTANSPSSVKGYRVAVDKFLAYVPDGTRFDYVVVDPPRGGFGPTAAEILAKLRTPRITYVSCDPATLARDLKVLAAAGYRIEALHLLDLFPQTFHIETVAKLIL